MKTSSDWDELGRLWASGPPPDLAALERQVRRRRVRAHAVSGIEAVISLAAVAFGAHVALHGGGWFSPIVGTAVVAFAAWAIRLSWAAQREAWRGDAAQSTREYLEQLRAWSAAALLRVGATYRVCLGALGFLGLLYAGALLELPGAPRPAAWIGLLSLAYIGGFAAVARSAASRRLRELKRVEELLASLVGD